ncbi:hypothetical protein BJX76DRAFT_175668 [Aspergillus varians]
MMTSAKIIKRLWMREGVELRRQNETSRRRHFDCYLLLRLVCVHPMQPLTEDMPCNLWDPRPATKGICATHCALRAAPTLLIQLTCISKTPDGQIVTNLRGTWEKLTVRKLSN